MGNETKCFNCDGIDIEHTGLHRESDLCVCRSCGNVFHAVSESENAKILDFYRNDYRGKPTYNNLLTTTNKLNYIRIFLSEFLKGKKELTVGDVGAATGYLVNFFLRSGHKAYGCELTKPMRRYSEHYYGVPLTEQLPDKKYDLITIYHVLEHMVNPVKEMLKLRDMLADGGHIMVSVPEYMSVLEDNTGMPMLSFENYFHKNHICAFSVQSLKNVFNRAGLEIVKEDHVQYGQTYLLRRITSADTTLGVVKEDWQKVLESLKAQKLAIELFQAKKYEAAAAAYPKFTDAVLGYLSEQYFRIPEKLVDELEKLNTESPDIYKSYRVKYLHANTLYQMARYEEAANLYGEIMKFRPTSEMAAAIGFCMHFLGDNRNAMRHFDIAKTLNPMKWAEMENWISTAACAMPTAEEAAMAKLISGKIADAPL